MNIAIALESAKPRRSQSKWLVLSAFLAPSVVLLAVFLLYPLLSSFQLSMLDWNGLGTDARFVGLENWVHLASDAIFLRALRNNLLLALFSILIQLPIALALAVLLEKAGRGSRTLKILYFLPLLMSSVAIGVLFKNVYDPNFGPLNAALHAVGLDSLAVDWLGDTRFALGATIAVICWQNIPFYMILFLAGLSSFPEEVAEAACLDGASPWTIFWRLKLPHLRGTLRTAAVLSIIGSLRYFDLIFVMTGGGPESASELMATYMYRTVFSSFQLGYGSAIASAMFLIVALVAAAALRITQRLATEN
ncbi:sugar ABC transporter permease [Trinickia caryophylli]|uniref:Carbohydrate ABC transporter membrane protein 1, CUT1 family n=1 Tax=Trinickia caryophylli TaxID=28094 RepID=A0A1X7D7W5_TRICW|nr:sugar ABC transporter permease [Trinickia caryophylli]PMS12661.1 sugar ABC transporter permease [Trinickia caryophylli]TRX15067.1 sugar ABC transporter permease [Trinickia caryophylli]WQE14926.1 sugar ABC transporter permease [Trinickia caryophylli]SMF10037.1 carbohydrate ABC transporter membrane protein 1, CUT1 family [Trinickia caryophylli]GLU31346.1 ABC transporter [Trinickia caryophylli]